MFKVAGRVGRTVAELEETLDYRELLDWIAFFDIEFKEHTKQDYYLAQIAAMHSGKKSSKINDFLIKFNGNNDLTDEERLEKSKNYWTAITGQIPKRIDDGKD